MTPEYLSSNVMNYLVLQYLNESGFYRAAESLRSSWLGPNSTVNDLGRLPFSHRVGRHALIGLAQDGLFLSTLEAEARNQPPKFSFGRDHGPDYAFQIDEPRPAFVYSEFSEKDGSPEKTVPDAEEGTIIAVEATAEVPVRKTQKRKRKSGNDKNAPGLVNGDANDTDTADAVQPPTHEPSVEPMEVEQQVLSPIISTAEIGFERGTSAEVQPRDLAADTLYIKRDAEIACLDWDPEDSEVLFIGGSNQADMHIIPNGSTPSNFASSTMPVDMGKVIFDVGRFIWIDSHEVVIVTSEHADDYSPFLPTQNTLRRVPEGGKSPRIFAKVIGTVTAMEYEPTSRQLVCLSLTGSESFVYVWNLTTEESPLVMRKFLKWGECLLDAAWFGPSQFLACGRDLMRRFSAKEDGTFDFTELPGFDYEDYHGLRLRLEPLHKRIAFVLDWDRRRKSIFAHDPLESTRSDPFMLPEKQNQQQGGDNDDPKAVEFAFEPATSRSDDSVNGPRRLAIAYDDGTIELWSCILDNSNPTASARATLIQTFTNKQLSTIGAIAFSPDGSFLAAASFGTVIIWSVDIAAQVSAYQNGDTAHPSNRGLAPVAIWNWQLDDGDQRDEWKPVPSENDHLYWVHSLKWGANEVGAGSLNGRIAYGLNTRVAIIDAKV